MKTHKSMLLPMLLVLVLAPFSMVWGAGKVHFARGDVTAVNQAGESRALSKGAVITAGDTIVVGVGALAQLKFTDGALVSLQPETSFRVDEYHYEGQLDGSEKGHFSLLRGGLRTITGAVGRQNRDNYKVNAAVATIGIRGTEYTAQLDATADGLGVHTGDGVIEVCNEQGCLELASGESGRVIANRRPFRTTIRPQLPPPAAADSTVAFYASTEARNAAGEHRGLASVGGEPVSPGDPALPVDPELPSELESGPGFHVAFASNALFSSVETAADADFDQNSNLLVLAATGDLFEAIRPAEDAQTESFADGGVIGWGYWDAAQLDMYGDHMSDYNFHYVVGKPTSSSDLAALGELNASYAFIGGDRLTGTDGNVGTLTGGQLGVHFSGGSIASTALILEGFAGDTDFTIEGSGSAGSGATFSGGDSGYFSYHGFLAGPGASHAGVAFEFEAANDYFHGAAAFKRE